MTTMDGLYLLLRYNKLVGSITTAYEGNRPIKQRDRHDVKASSRTVCCFLEGVVGEDE
jgi:hypothetical protein